MTIDWWTLGFQFVNVVVLVWLLGHFFWRPVAAMIEARRDVTARIIADAEAHQSKVESAEAEIAETRAGMAAERERLLAAARQQAEEIRARIRAEAEDEIAAERERVRVQVARERRKAERAWNDSAARLAVDIARRLLEPHDGAAVRARFLDDLVAELGRLPDADRTAASAPGATLRVVSAAELPPEEQEACRSRISEVLGATPQVVFAADPDLIAGLDLVGPGFAVHNSWRAELDRIRAEVSHDRRS